MEELWESLVILFSTILISPIDARLPTCLPGKLTGVCSLNFPVFAYLHTHPPVAQKIKINILIIIMA
jgi:hypothetical protein